VLRGLSEAELEVLDEYEGGEYERELVDGGEIGRVFVYVTRPSCGSLVVRENEPKGGAVDLAGLHERAVAEFGTRVEAVGPGDWGRPTVNDGWDVRALVNHVVGEELWTPPLLEGKTIADVGDRYDGDVLGSEPWATFKGAAEAAVASINEPGALERTVHLSFGDTPAREYAWQLFADHLIHAWDLARALGADDRLDPELVDACAQWFAGMEELYRSWGAIAPRPPIPDDADAQTRLLAAFGRDATH
jgi:uncharacterized protein (TIGR03086 family)